MLHPYQVCGGVGIGDGEYQQQQQSSPQLKQHHQFLGSSAQMSNFTPQQQYGVWQQYYAQIGIQQQQKSAQTLPFLSHPIQQSMAQPSVLAISMSSLAMLHSAPSLMQQRLMVVLLLLKTCSWHPSVQNTVAENTCLLKQCEADAAAERQAYEASESQRVQAALEQQRTSAKDAAEALQQRISAFPEPIHLAGCHTLSKVNSFVPFLIACLEATSMSGHHEAVWKEMLPKLRQVFSTETTSAEEVADLTFKRCGAVQRFVFDEADGFCAHFVKFVEAEAANVLKCCQKLDGLLSNYIRQFRMFFSFANAMESALNTTAEDWKMMLPVMAVSKLTVSIWKSVIFDELQHNITSAALALVEKDRCGERIDTELIRSVVNSYIELGINESEPAEGGGAAPVVAPPQQVHQRPTIKYHIYRTFFEQRFLEDTRNFYTAESNSFLQSHDNNVPDYMVKVEKWLGEERDRCQIYLDSTTMDALMAECDNVLIKQHSELFHDRFESLLRCQQNDHLRRMYTLCARVQNGLAKLKEILEGYIEREGKTAIQQIAKEAFNDPKQYITCILKMHELYNRLVVDAFKSDHGFVRAMDCAFCKFINTNTVTMMARSASKSPQLLVLYCDQLLRKRSMEPSEMDENLEQVMTVFKYIDDKDMFQAFFHKFLCKRLVYDTSSSEESERCMIAKLKHMCGSEYTSKSEQLLTNVALSRVHSKQFKQRLSKSGVDFSVIVVRSNVWPLQQPMNFFKIPRPLLDCIDYYSHYYATRFNGRKLSWALQMSQGELVSLENTFQANYTFICNTQQIAILMQFNKRNMLTLGKLHAALGADFPRDQLCAVVQSLVKTKLLKLSGADGSALTETSANDDQQRLAFNPDFQSHELEVDLLREMSAVKEIKKQVEDVKKTADAYVTEAAIVRIMKTHQTMTHHQLVADVLAELEPRFKIDEKFIKRCIGSVIEREYLRRSEHHDQDTYEYLP